METYVMGLVAVLATAATALVVFLLIYMVVTTIRDWFF